MTIEINDSQVSRQSPRTVIGFDFGTYKIGIAVGQEVTGIANALTTITAIQQKPDWDKISQIITEWQPALLIVGLPLNEDGSIQDMTQKARRFGNQLHGRYNLKTVWMDERFSSLAAKSLIIEQIENNHHPGKKNAKNDLAEDAIAAQIIVQSWLDNPEIAKTEIEINNA
ncbi:MAG: Holliday junction resolvase RuvX [Thiohalomonadales bacterium]